MGLGGKVRSRERKIEEEWFFSVGLDKLDRLGGETFSQSTIIERVRNQILVPPEYLRLVVALVDIKSCVKTLFHGL